ncbi:MAG: hypothetical protein AAF990_01135 [Bacteroidota bacterium]
MKDAPIILTAFLLLLLNTSIFAQNRIFPQQAPMFQQTETISMEITGPSVMGINPFNNDSVILNLSIVFEVVLTGEVAPSFWDQAFDGEAAYSGFYFPNNSNRFMEFTASTNHALSSLSHTYQGSFLNDQIFLNIYDDGHESVMPLNSLVGWVRLDAEEWDEKDKLEYESQFSSLGEWQFKLGPDEKSYYFVPMVL